jgi:hypothetical protein
VAALNQILPHLTAIASPIERSRFIPILADRLGVEDSLILGEVSRAVKERRSAIAPPPPAVAAQSGVLLESEAGLGRILIEDPDARAELLSTLEPSAVEKLRTGSILSAIREMVLNGESVAYASIAGRLGDSEDSTLLGRIAMRSDPPGGVEEGRACLASLERERLRAERRRLQSRIETAAGTPALDGLLARKVEISRRIDELS